MGAVALFGVWLLTIALVSGGTVWGDQTRLVLPSFAFGVGTFDPSAVQRVQLAPSGLFWLVPFTAATAVYLFATALALGTRHPVRWIAASTCAFFLIVGLADAAQVNSSLDCMLTQILRGPYGIDAVLTARTESLQVSAMLTTGESVVVWRALPHLNQWAIATALWISIGAALLWIAASRHREHRRG